MYYGLLLRPLEEASFLLYVGRLVGWEGVAVSRTWHWGGAGCVLPVLLKVNYSVEKGVPAVKKC